MAANRWKRPLKSQQCAFILLLIASPCLSWPTPLCCRCEYSAYAFWLSGQHAQLTVLITIYWQHTV